MLCAIGLYIHCRSSVLFFSRPRSEGWSHHGRTFSICPCPLSFCLTLPRRVLSTSWCCPSRPCVAFLAWVHLYGSLHYLSRNDCFTIAITIKVKFLWSMICSTNNTIFIYPDASLADLCIETSDPQKQCTARWCLPQASHDPGTPTDQLPVV